MSSLSTPITRAAATRDRILDAAAALFWRRSYHSVAMDELAEATQVNKATIYRYFADKADIARQVARLNGQRVEAGVFEFVFDAYTAPDDRLLAIYACMLTQLRALYEQEGDVFGCPIVGLTLELGVEMPELRQISVEIFGRVERRFHVIAQDAIDARMISQHDAAELASTLVKILHGAFVASHLAAEPSPFVQAANASAALLGSTKKIDSFSGEMI